MTTTAPKFGWGHININVRNLDRSIAFYELLGFEPFRAGIPYLGLTDSAEYSALPDSTAQALGVPAKTSARACIMQLNEGYPKIDLIEFSGTPDATETGQTAQATPKAPGNNADLGFVRLCLATRNLHAAYAYLAARDVRFISRPQLAKDGMADIAVCIDPDGALIELIQAHRDKWPAPPSGE